MAELTPKTVNELPSVSSFQDTDLFAIASGGTSKKALWSTIKGTLTLLVYPVGSIYMSVESTNPATLFGGTWARIEDRFLLAAGETYAAGSTGGAANHTLTIAEMPAHNHGMGLNGTGSEYAHTVDWATSSTGSGTTGMAGDGQAFPIMPPYLAVYVWKRTA